MKLQDGFITQEIGGMQMMVAVGEAANRFHGLVRSNETAAFVIDALKSETTEAEIVDRLLEEYDVSRPIAEADVHLLLEKLRSIGAIASS